MQAVGHMKSRPSILVVEDDFVVGMMIRDTLNNAGFDVIGIARNTEQANAKASGPDLAVMDVRLADGDDGIDAAASILRRFNIRCIFVTAHPDEMSRTRAKGTHPLGWVAKPFRPRVLVDAVIDALELCEHEGPVGFGTAPSALCNINPPSELSI